jgi:hypothetical protein
MVLTCTSLTPSPSAISIAGVFALTVIDRDMDLAPGWETGINAVFVGIHRASRLDHFGDSGLDRRLPDLAAQSQETLPITRDHAQHWRLVGGCCPTPPFSFAPSTPTYTPHLGQSSAVDHA